MKEIIAIIVFCLALIKGEINSEILIVSENNCHQVFDKDQGQITSLGYPTFSSSNSSCTYVIKAKKGQVISLQWKDFNLPAGHDRLCHGSSDSVVVYDGRQIGINNLYTPMCGNHSFDITSSGNMMTVVLSSTSDEFDIMSFYRGFKAAYKSMSHHCKNMIYKTGYGAIASPHFPMAYPANLDCVYTIKLNQDRVMLLEFAEFALKPVKGNNNKMAMDDCDDYVEVYEGAISQRNRYFRHCGYYKPHPITTGGNIVHIKLHSAKSQLALYTGFRAFYYSGVPNKCGLFYGTPSGALTIPVIPQTSGINVECQFTIKSPQVAYYRVRWLSFGQDLFKKGCDENNYIEIYNGFYDKKDKLLAKKCDTKLDEFDTQYNEMLVRFKIEKFNPSRNFKFIYIGVTNNTVKVITDKNQTCTAKTTIVYRYSGPEVISREVKCELFSIGGLPFWASLLIVCGAGGGGLGAISVAFCLIRRRIRARRRYRRFERSDSEGSL
ncbi:uncharacterized protein TRIADDRAFT_53272 [Trichoplax adhaerens]|uniref:CUB domain-containing protein n=1 Tax=Trichoplax adhaerens TaxID=10228 RepID=B3RNS7_TRIAD|nr:hypothetical protein TRIADDRAFT_53272 [Trichoplax adhaerens]EDV28064.1 hypothetical protein TRIADDRAFT_53272 [Trichoplax adhaerens]|eukprot:XP_002109898.1 hypothetical protein TRIADDRAFT_53272 [Trichoplax adhaerens]